MSRSPPAHRPPPAAAAESACKSATHRPRPSAALFAWLISHQPAVLFSHNKLAISNQPTVLFSQNKPALDISHQPTEQTARRGLPPPPLGSVGPSFHAIPAGAATRPTDARGENASCRLRAWGTLVRRTALRVRLVPFHPGKPGRWPVADVFPLVNDAPNTGLHLLLPAPVAHPDPGRSARHVSTLRIWRSLNPQHPPLARWVWVQVQVQAAVTLSVALLSQSCSVPAMLCYSCPGHGTNMWPVPSIKPGSYR
jgi:hypothetical protein